MFAPWRSQKSGSDHWQLIHFWIIFVASNSRGRIYVYRKCLHVFLRITEHYYIIKLSSLEGCDVRHLSICRSRDFILISCVRLAENDLQIMFSSKRESPKIHRNSQLTIGTKIFCISNCNKFTSITNGVKETTTDCRLLARRAPFLSTSGEQC